MAKPDARRLAVENVKLKKALEQAREYVYSDVRNKRYPWAIEVLAAIDEALES